MNDDERKAYGVELLLQEPEIVAWLGDYVRTEEDEPDDDDPPRAA